MPVPSPIAQAAIQYGQNHDLLEKSFQGLSPDEWLKSPAECSNNLLWIAGHIVWARSMALGFLGSLWSRPWLSLFARGAKLVDPAQYPSQEEVITAWRDVSESLTAALENASVEALSAPSPVKSPSFDGKMSGLVSFLAFHETYHVGQICYLRCWLGHDGVVG